MVKVYLSTMLAKNIFFHSSLCAVLKLNEPNAELMSKGVVQTFSFLLMTPFQYADLNKKISFCTNTF